jgi:hypothetical protein
MITHVIDAIIKDYKIKITDLLSGIFIIINI